MLYRICSIVRRSLGMTRVFTVGEVHVTLLGTQELPGVPGEAGVLVCCVILRRPPIVTILRLVDHTRKLRDFDVLPPSDPPRDPFKVFKLSVESSGLWISCWLPGMG